MRPWPGGAEFNQISKSNGREFREDTCHAARSGPQKSINQIKTWLPPQILTPGARSAPEKNRPFSAQTLIKPCVFLPNRRAKRADFFENRTSLNQIGGADRGKNHPNSKIHWNSIKLQNQTGGQSGRTHATPPDPEEIQSNRGIRWEANRGGHVPDLPPDPTDAFSHKARWHWICTSVYLITLSFSRQTSSQPAGQLASRLVGRHVCSPGEHFSKWKWEMQKIVKTP